MLRFREVLGERLMATYLSKPRLRTVLNQPELNIVLFAFLLNFVWEMLQIPFFRGVAQRRPRLAAPSERRAGRWLRRNGHHRHNCLRAPGYKSLGPLEL